ncbi:sensor histidine kinase [Kordiimonas lacus]|uniref:histidine kinase n=1 Tax=Kordiimonas lacus TaxID=637679 RepID=A0A1G7A971_9PROT|nr:HAMP domain-containing sensor histidine kinase [Kordiimonas lacus]SDE11027.1 Signal transduction histidine kinase [Kordiimonas lacus]
MMRASRRVRSMIMRLFVGAMVSSFAVFTLMVVIFGFSLEDEIFDLQVRDAATEFINENPSPLELSGTMPGLKMTYYIGTEAMPDWLKAQVDPTYRNGAFEVFGKEHGHFHALVRTLDDGRNLYVFFNARPFIRSTPQIKGFLVIIGGMVALGLLISLFFLARMSRKVSGPLEHMAQVLGDGDSVAGRMTIPKSAPRELQALARAIEDREARIQELIERERQFNRDASHELRTPLSVAYGAAEVLEEKEGGKSRALMRLKAAIKDMQQLTEGILWLGRDPGRAQACDVSAVCASSIRAYGHLVGDRPVTIRQEGEGVSMPVPEAVAHVMVGNILRNALSYTEEGEVLVSAAEGTLEITDTGVGFGHADPAKQGFGVGLTLVSRLCDHFRISFEATARPDGGTVARLTWRDID